MKKIYFLFFAILSSSSSFGQIWSEDFSTYTNGTGIEGSTGGVIVNIGDYSSVTKWTLDATGAALTAATDWAKTDAGLFSFRDIDGPVQWNSEVINISGAASPVSFALDASNNTGRFEPTDFFDVYYSIDGDAFALIQDWNGLGDTKHTILGEKGSVNWSTVENIKVTRLTGNTLQIRVEAANNVDGEQFLLDNIIVNSGDLPPAIPLTPPESSTVFAPVTTSVNAEWTTATSAYSNDDFGTPISRDSFDNKSAFSIFPNPVSNGFVNIKTTSNEVVNVAVFNILGKQVITQKLANNTLNVSNLNSGVYLVKLTQNGVSTTKKLIVE